MGRIDTAMRLARAARVAAMRRGQTVDHSADWQDMTPADEPSADDFHGLPTEGTHDPVHVTPLEPEPSSATTRWHVRQKAESLAAPAPPTASMPLPSLVHHPRPSPLPARPERVTPQIARTVSHDTGILSNTPSGPPATVNADRMFDALDRVLAQAPLASPQRAVPTRRETTG